MQAVKETARSNCVICLTARNFSDIGIEHQHHAPFILAREFAHHQPAGFCRDLPIDEPPAIGRLIIAQGMQFVTAASKMACHLSAQQWQNLVELVRRLHGRIDGDFHIRLHPPRLFEEAEGKARANTKRILPVDPTPLETKFHFLSRSANSRRYTERKQGGVRISSGDFLLPPTTRSEKEGHICFSLRNSISASTGWPAKMCSGKSNFTRNACQAPRGKALPKPKFPPASKQESGKANYFRC